MDPTLYTAFAAVTEDNRAGQLWVTTIVCVIYSVLVFILRVQIKYRMFGLDDGLLGVATVSLHSTLQIITFTHSVTGQFLLTKSVIRYCTLHKSLLYSPALIKDFLSPSSSPLQTNCLHLER